MGKIIYESKGKAAEYARYAFSAYVGCSNSCSYCYLRRGRFAKVLGGDTPTLKKCFCSVDHALEVFRKELKANLPELQRHGMFFSFTTDPMLPETSGLTFDSISLCCQYHVPVKILTKRVDMFDCFFKSFMKTTYSPHESLAKEYIAWGFTLTGHDELEPGASTNAERIEAMKKLHAAGFKTWASIEPVVEIESSKEMIRETAGYCDLYKIGLMSGKKYDKEELISFVVYCNSPYLNGKGGFYWQKNYFKDSLLKQAGIDRATLPGNCVGRDYNIFKA